MDWDRDIEPKLKQLAPEEVGIPEIHSLEDVYARLAANGIHTDPVEYRKEAQKFKGSREVAIEWSRRSTGIGYKELVTYSTMLWMALLPNAPDAAHATANIILLALQEPEEWCLEWVLKTKRRVMQLATFAYEVRPEAPERWLGEAILNSGQFDLLGFVVYFVKGLHDYGATVMAAEVARAWCPLLCELDWRNGTNPCWCGSGRKMRACCDRVGRG